MGWEYTAEIDLIATRYEVRDDGTGTIINQRCEQVVSEQDFEWVHVDDLTIRMIPPNGSEVFENVSGTSILLHDATTCVGNDPGLAQYTTERLANGKLEGGTEGTLFRTTFCTEAHPVTGPCPNDTECGPGFCDYFWCEGEEPEPCDLDE